MYKDLRLRNKLIVILTLAFGGLAMVSIAYAATQFHLASTRQTQVKLDRIVDTASDTFLAMSRLQTLADQFHRYTVNRSIEQVQEMIPVLNREMTQLSELARGSPAERHVVAINADLGRYLQLYNSIVNSIATLGVREDMGLEGQFRSDAHALEALLSADALTADVAQKNAILTLIVDQLTMRRREKDFVLRGEGKYLQDWEDAYQQFIDNLPLATLSDTARANRMALLNSYGDGFRRFAAEYNRLRDQQKEFDAWSGRLLGAFTELKGLTQVNARENRLHEDAERDFFTWLLITPLIGSVVILGGGAYLLAKSVSAPLLRLSKAMQKLAEGDLAVDVPETDRRDEIGAMAKTVMGFQKNAQQIFTLQKNTEAAKLRAEEAVLSKSTFIANTSHELRTPLNAIIGFSDFMAHGYAGAVSAKQSEYIADIHDAGKHLLNIINDILDISKADAGRITLVEDDVHVEDVALSTLRLVEQRAKESGVTMSVEVDPDLPILRVDELRLRQILLNLLSNAVKFTRAAGTVVVRGSLDQQGDLTILVKDTGIGMNAEQVTVAMEMYGQVGPPQMRGLEGTGLGLPLSKKLTELLGGTFALASSRGVGTEVSLTWPASRLSRIPAQLSA